MKKLLFIIVCLIASFGGAKAQVQDSPTTMKVYCEVMCVQYNLFKGDVNAVVDFGIADKAKNADGWIYNTETNKKMSFASPMSVFAYMAKNGWEYKDAIIITEANGIKGKQNVWHFILTKEMPIDCTPEDIIGNIDYRNK
ncbi:hypothetical protein ED352_08980 [Muribaculaceae bacterium Isolate-002 (NCI)]|nr:hypothetical protein ED352_08980 [Muribaculaceae bacterium Isolate-002 (NCI)]